MPAGDSGAIFTFAIVTMSFGAVALMIAFSRCDASSDIEQRARRVLFGAEDPQALLRAVAHFGGVGPEKRRRAGDQRAVDDREVQRHVVPLDAPAPGVLRRRRAEDREEVALRVADERRVAAAAAPRPRAAPLRCAPSTSRDP